MLDRLLERLPAEPRRTLVLLGGDRPRGRPLPLPGPRLPRRGVLRRGLPREDGAPVPARRAAHGVGPPADRQAPDRGRGRALRLRALGLAARPRARGHAPRPRLLPARPARARDRARGAPRHPAAPPRRRLPRPEPGGDDQRLRRALPAAVGAPPAARGERGAAAGSGRWRRRASPSGSRSRRGGRASSPGASSASSSSPCARGAGLPPRASSRSGALAFARRPRRRLPAELRAVDARRATPAVGGRCDARRSAHLELPREPQRHPHLLQPRGGPGPGSTGRPGTSGGRATGGCAASWPSATRPSGGSRSRSRRGRSRRACAGATRGASSPGAGFFLLYLPWGLSPRTLNFSHYLFEAIPYACLSLGILLDRAWDGRHPLLARGYVVAGGRALPPLPALPDRDAGAHGSLGLPLPVARGRALDLVPDLGLARTIHEARPDLPREWSECVCMRGLTPDRIIHSVGRGAS